MILFGEVIGAMVISNGWVIRLARETLRARSARRDRRRQLNASTTNPPDISLEPPPEAPLMVRLKDPNQMVEERPKSRLGQLNPFSRSDQSFPTSKSEIKETLKRPLSNIYNYDLPGFENPEIKKLDDIDLTLLIRFLQLEEEVTDEQVPWTWDYLYANVLTETREDWDPDEELPDNP
ncbi:hypothetical protein FO519_007101 [Halicephalobus sp. NKZ332]|nr:hypothetical protein FO519_007101 [Halicephalobus sp. NKZ332]